MLNILKLYKKILDFLYPFYCIRCKTILDYGYLCNSCLSELNFNLKIICPKCQRRKPIEESFTSICCVNSLRCLIYFTDYENEVIRQIVKLGKFYGYYKLWEFIGNIIADNFNNINLYLSNFYITYIPMTKKELKNRGFNQAKILSEVISKKLNLKIFDGLIKIKETKQQATLGFKERIENIKNAFYCKYNPPPNIILIDDIFTTGSTLIEASKILKEKGTRIIIGVTFAK